MYCCFILVLCYKVQRARKDPPPCWFLLVILFSGNLITLMMYKGFLKSHTDPFESSYI